MNIEELCTKNIDRLTYMAYHFVNNSSDADDLLQTSMLRAIKYFKSFSGDFNNWMFSIIRNVYRDSHSEVLQMDLTEADEVLDDVNPEDIILKKERITQVRDALQELRKKDKDILDLYYFQGVSYENIAELLQVPLGTVRSKLFTAKNNLKKRLEGL